MARTRKLTRAERLYLSVPIAAAIAYAVAWIFGYME
jgi:hypothetical protein